MKKHERLFKALTPKNKNATEDKADYILALGTNSTDSEWKEIYDEFIIDYPDSVPVKKKVTVTKKAVVKKKTSGTEKTVKFKVGSPVYVKSQNSVGHIIDMSNDKKDMWYRTDVDGVRYESELESFKISDLNRKDVRIPGGTEDFKKQLKLFKANPKKHIISLYPFKYSWVDEYLSNQKPKAKSQKLKAEQKTDLQKAKTAKAKATDKKTATAKAAKDKADAKTKADKAEADRLYKKALADTKEKEIQNKLLADKKVIEDRLTKIYNDFNSVDPIKKMELTVTKAGIYKVREKKKKKPETPKAQRYGDKMQEEHDGLIVNRAKKVTLPARHELSKTKATTTKNAKLIKISEDIGNSLAVIASDIDDHLMQHQTAEAETISKGFKALVIASISHENLTEKYMHRPDALKSLEELGCVKVERKGRKIIKIEIDPKIADNVKVIRQNMIEISKAIKFAKGGSISGSSDVATFINKTNDLTREQFGRGFSKGDLMKLAYGKTYSNVDSALPLGLLEEKGINPDERWHYVMDYNDNTAFGKLTDLYDKIAERNPTVEIYDKEYKELGKFKIKEAAVKFKGKDVMFSAKEIDFAKGGKIKYDIVEYKVPEWSLSYLINGDASGLTDEDEIKVNKFTDKVVKQYGHALFSPADDDEDFELGFCPTNDIDNLGSNCYKILLLVGTHGEDNKEGLDDLEFGFKKGGKVKKKIKITKKGRKTRKKFAQGGNFASPGVLYDPYYVVDYYARVGEHGEANVFHGDKFKEAVKSAVEFYNREKKSKTLRELSYIGVTGNADEFAIIYLSETYLKRITLEDFSDKKAYDNWMKAAKSWKDKPVTGKY